MLNMRIGLAALTVAWVWSALPAEGQTPQQWRDSLSTLSRQIEQQPRSTDLRLKKAAVNIELGQWDYAADEYGRVLAIDPDNLAARYYRAYANSHRRQYALAKSDYETFVSRVPLHMEARLGLAMVNEKMGRRTEAMDRYNELVEMFPDSALCYAARAAFEATIGQYDTALYDWQQAISRQPLNADYVATKAELLISLDRGGEARSLLMEAVERGIAYGLLKPWIDRCGPATQTKKR